MNRHLLSLALAVSCLPLASAAELRDHENRFQISLFAASPLVENPIGVQVDDRGRVYVIESHTHFRPAEYDGPKSDRILLLEDTDADGRADKRQVFHEGFVHAMDLALHDDGSLYVATRSAIHRLRDTDADGRADQVNKLIDLETKGDYPHNGLSGLAFDGKGGMYFGFGENLGADYNITGATGAALSGGAEGGSVFHAMLDGTRLRRVATGFWNPFGVCVDRVGNVFATDNDPDSSPPCRLLHVIEGGDYGYEFRYGRSGLHVFQCWNGELPATLPMITGTGEAPCEIVPYDGGLLVASWADNRLEHYTLRPHGASFTADRKILISGDLNFRPVGIGVGRDKALYVSDWSSASYELTDKGKLWRLTPRRSPQHTTVEPADSLQPIYEASNMALLHQLMVADPFVQTAAIHRLSQLLSADAKQRVHFEQALAAGLDTDYTGIVAALRRSTWDKRYDDLPKFLAHRDPRVRFMALKWIADERLEKFRDEVERGLHNPDLTRQLFAAHLAALERLDGRKIGELPDPRLVLPLLKDNRVSPQVRAFALQSLPPNHPELSIAFLRALVDQTDEPLRREAVRTINDAPTPERQAFLSEIAGDTRRSKSLRAEAIAALAGTPPFKDQLLDFALGGDPILRDEALRSLVDIPLTGGDRRRLAQRADLPEVARLLHRPIEQQPPLSDLAAWQQRLAGDGDPQAGRRIFFHQKVGYCSRCHRIDGRGNNVGPDLTKIGQRDAEWLLTSVLQPSRDVAPGFRQWRIEMKDGTERIGISLRKGSHSEDYRGADGKEFSVRLADVESRSEIDTSMMPAGLPQTMTAKELRDVLAFLRSP
jgi:putative membrane-bound dehydrogenase-like protein